VATGGAETDLVFEAARLVFSRWQIQCKNTAQGVTLDDIAKEVGLVHMLKSNVIIMVSTGKISPDARVYANSVMRQSNLCIVMVDRTDLESITENAPAIVDVLQREAAHAMRLKKLELE
jgi:site-specific DNA-methyltransferase (cytosine-N4-specific)